MFRSLFLRVGTIVASHCEEYGKNFSVSNTAWDRIAEVNQQEGYTNRDRTLRLSIESGGCHGYLYKFSFENASAVDEGEDVTVVKSEETDAPRFTVDKYSIGKLQNATVDFYTELKGSAFVVVGNELVDQSCACAMSFSVKKKSTKPTAAAKLPNRPVGMGKPIAR